jgi:putative transcriptional regulator
MESSLRERFARLGPIRTIDRVPSGSPAAFVLTPLVDRKGLKTVTAAVELARRGISLLRAKRALEQMIFEGQTFVALPVVDDVDTVVGLMASFGIRAALHGAPDAVDVKAIRDGLGLTQEEFATRFGLGLDTVQNWESGRRQPDRTARSYLTVIAREPRRVEEALRPAGDA